MSIHLVPVVVPIRADTHEEAVQWVRTLLNNAAVVSDVPHHYFLPNEGENFVPDEEWHLEWVPGKAPEELGNGIRWDPEREEFI